ncbi:MAG: hypothetical protein ACOCOU_02690, partial [Prevotella sp.]
VSALILYYQKSFSGQQYISIHIAESAIVPFILENTCFVFFLLPKKAATSQCPPLEIKIDLL